MFEYSSVSRFNFKNGIIKKVDRYVEAQNNQVIIGYDFFKELHEENDKDECLSTMYFASADELFTHTKL